MLSSINYGKTQKVSQIWYLSFSFCQDMEEKEQK